MVYKIFSFRCSPIGFSRKTPYQILYKMCVKCFILQQKSERLHEHENSFAFSLLVIKHFVQNLMAHLLCVSTEKENTL